MTAAIDAFIALRSGERLMVGRDRIRLLEAVAEHGTITAAAKAAGFSYKTAWDAVNAINNLLPSPAFVTRTGGKAGGGVEVTEEGRRLITTFRALEARITRISQAIAKDGIEIVDDGLLWLLGSQISTRNVFCCEVSHLDRGAVEVEVWLKVGAAHKIRAIVTNAAATSLLLAPGRRVLALVKAPFIRLIDAAEAPQDDANRFIGRVMRRVDAEPRSEIVLEIAAGKTMTAVIQTTLAENLGIAVDKTIAATFEARAVILAAN